jgi:uncharacterized protein
MSGIQGRPFRVVLLAATILTLLVTSSMAADIETLRKQAEAGNAQAQFDLGFAYAKGQGVPQDYTEAVKWTRKAAVQGSVGAQYNLGTAYYYGEGVLQDYAEANMWFRKAAEQGLTIAQFNLGAAYSSGQGVSQDYVHSYFWYSLAASRSAGEDHEKYTEARDLVAEKLTPEKLTEAQRMTWEWEKSHPQK